MRAYDAGLGCAGAGFLFAVDFDFFAAFLVPVEGFFSASGAVASGVARSGVVTCDGVVIGAIACMGGKVGLALAAPLVAGTLS